jgi:hypothetical protein
VERADSPAELAAVLRRYAQSKPADLYRRAAYYNATLGTPDEGRSQIRTISLLNNWLK